MFRKVVASAALLLGLSNAVTTELDNSCVGKEDGEYWLQLSVDNSKYTPVKVLCNNEFIIIDVANEPGLEDYFSSWTKWHYALAGPINSDPVTWQDWFIPERSDSDAKYALSPDCNTCDTDSNIQVFGEHSTYWMTGSLAKLFWGITGFNECDFDTDDYSCFNCQACSNTGACLPLEIPDTAIDYTTGGMCGVAVNPSYKAVYESRRETQTLATTPHFKPSIGTDGRFCVCYRPSLDDIETYSLTDEQASYVDNEITRLDKGNEMLKYIYSNGMRVDGHSPFETVDGTINENADYDTLIPDEIQDKRNTNIIYLKQSDFLDGTYRILESGTYILSEDIEINFNSNDNYWPRADQAETYIGADSYRDAYNMGFFAGITVESNYVTIDLNNKELKMAMEFYYMQRWFALIELSNAQFLPGQGPSFFGAYTVNVKEITIKDGTLGRCSHFAIHGNHAKNVLIENVHIRDFVTHGMQLNGWDGLLMKNVEIGPNSELEYLRGEYGHGRLISKRLRAIESLMLEDGSIGDTITFVNRSPQTITELADELDAQMSLAFEYAMNRGVYGGKHADTDYIDPSNLETADQRARWHKAKELFTHQSGIPSASSVTGMFLNFDGANVNTYAKYTMPDHQSNHAYLENVYIHDLTHDFEESHKLAGHGYLYTTPWLTDIPAEGTMGNKKRLMEFYNAIHSNDDNEDADSDESPDLSEFEYVGNALTDSYVAMWVLNDDWDILGFLAMVMKDDTANLADWAQGKISANENWRINCNQDSMSHSGKGLLGLRLDGSNDVTLKNVKVANLYQYSQLGAMVCGEYSWVDEDGEGGHFRQRTPQQTGFSGNNLQAVSISSSTNIRIEGNLEIDNINTDYSEGYGISVWTANSISVDKDALISVSNVNTGKKLSKGTLTYDSLPNRSPEACAIRLQTSDDLSDNSYLFDTEIIFEHNDDTENTGSLNIVTCNVEGHEYCMGDETNGYTMYGNEFGISTACENIDTQKDIHKYSKILKNDVSNKNSNNANAIGVGSGKGLFGSLTDLNTVAIMILIASLVGIIALVATYYTRLTQNSKHRPIEEQHAATDPYRYGAI